MNNDFRYRLETPRITGRRQQKTTCPACGRRKCFVRYIDTHHNNQYVAEQVGKCDHQHSCGYHYTPAQFYRDHPYTSAPANPRTSAPATPRTPVPTEPFRPLPFAYVQQSLSGRSMFWQWFSRQAAPRIGITPERVQQLLNDYFIGATRQGHVIFWQIDQQGNAHAGHIMQYRADGHREGYQGWTHVPLIRQGLLPPHWALHQCLFGQHLLKQHPQAPVAIVESEKTAIVMAACQPQAVWLATAGSGGLSAERLQCLEGRRVTLFPDSGCFEKWNQKMQTTQNIHYNVSDALEKYPPNTDLCDLIFL